jgi:fido (protein-threonine AMPylation protein)
MNLFNEYDINKDKTKYEKAGYWKIAIGLQKVDNLDVSPCLIGLAKKNIDGEITIDEVKRELDSYYKTNKNIERDTIEADKVSASIVIVLSNNSFEFTISNYINIHKQLFSGIYDFAGKIRNYNITKKEDILDGDTVYYASYYNILETIEYDFEKEKEFKYKGLSKKEIVEHIAFFVSNLWQIHIFGEGNTRTTAVFLIKYLNTIGFKTINSDVFKNYSLYFRNSLVRANYENIIKRVHRTKEYLVLFLENLLFNTNHILDNKELAIDTSK